MISAFRNKLSAVSPFFAAVRAMNAKPLAGFASNKEVYNPTTYDSLKSHKWLLYDPKHANSAVTHKSLSELYISRIPVIEVEENVVRCMGGTAPGKGHPQVYVQLNTRFPEKHSTCPYCGLKFKRKPHGHHGHNDQHGPTQGHSH